MRGFDWTSTPVGAAAAWPQSLRIAVGMLLSSRHPMFLWWGPELVQFYNDGYRPSLGADRHPAALGASGREFWREIWPAIGPDIDAVMARGESSWYEDRLVPIFRNGRLEEVYWTYGYSPVRDDRGSVGGTLVVVQEQTARILGQRRLRTLRDLASHASRSRTETEAWSGAVAALAENPKDVPWAVVYALDASGASPRLAGHTLDSAPALGVVATAGDIDRGPWPLGSVVETGRPLLVTDVRERVGAVLGPAWPEPIESAWISVVGGSSATTPSGVLVCGLSPRLTFDADYRDFIALAADQIATAVANARASEDERRRAEALAELDRAKTSFFSNVSHEFRTPLTLLLGPLRESLEAAADPVERERLRLAHRNAMRLEKLVNVLLDFSRIEAGRLQATFEPTDLSGLTADLAGSFRSACEKAGLALLVDCEPLVAPVYVDRDMWEKIVLNLLSNAVKFTFEGQIAVSVHATASNAILSIRDTGTGIDEQDLPRIFDRFYRVDRARARTHEGTGIGLALVQELVHLHGGTVSVASVRDAGTTFTVSMPMGLAHLPAGRIARRAAPEPAASGRQDRYADEALEWLAESAPVRSKLDVSRARVLLADDNADMRKYLSGLLGTRFDVESVCDGEAALEAIRRRPPDLVVTDVMMPHVDGFELVQRLRADDGLRTIPVLLLTARAGEDARVEGLQGGADDYVTKPFSSRELLARVGAAIELSRMRQRNVDAHRAGEARFREMADNAPMMVWVTEADGTCSFLSKSWYDFTGQTPGTAIGPGWSEAIHPEDRQAAVALFEAACASRERVRGEYRLRRADGEYRWAIDTAVPRFAPDGEFLGFIGSVIDITDRKDAEDRREQALEAERTARAEAERVNRMKDEFLATLSHELRAPLNAIVGWSELLAEDALDLPETRRALASIERHARAQAHMIEELLDMNRITTGKIHLHVEPLVLADIVEQAVQAFAPTADAKGVRLLTAIDPGSGPVLGDPERLRQVFSNLLANAVKFTPPGGNIQVSVHQSARSAVLTVTDTGEGIEAGFVPYVFDRFSQGDATTTRAQPGLGLGLSIVKGLVELHGGEVEASSPGRDLGATFTVSLPLAAGAARPYRQALQPAGKTVPERSPLPSLDGIRILVVDDDADAREPIERILTRARAAVVTANSAAEARAILRRERFDLLVSDVGMPVEDGCELIRSIRALPSSEGGDVQAVALTAYARPEDRQRALRAGFQMHIAKPVAQAELLTVCASLTGRL